MARFGTLLIGCLGSILALATTAPAETVTFHFAQVGNAYSAFLAPDDPLVGQQVVSATIFLDVQIFQGSNAANFFTDITFPIEPLPGNENTLVLLGSDLGWSGSGVFHYSLTTSMFNGVFVPGRYGAETPGEGYNGTILDSSRIEIQATPAAIPEPGSVVLLVVGGVLLAGRKKIRGIF